MARIQTIEKGTIQRISKPLDKLESKVDKLLELTSKEPTLYYFASLNLLSRPLILFNTQVKSFSSTEPIEITKEDYIDLKSKHYFKNEVSKKEDNTTKLIGVEYIDNEVQLQRHNYIEQKLKHLITKAEEPPTESSIKPSIESSIKQIQPIISIQPYHQKYPQLNLDRKPSKYQEDILDYIIMLVNNDPRATQKHMVVEATAGSGKTWTIEQATKLIPSSKTACFLAFNTTIVDIFRPRAPFHIKNNVMTLNSAGFTSVRQALELHHKRLRSVNKNNVSAILDYLFNDKYKEFSLDEIDALKPAVIRSVSLFKATGLETTSSNLEYLLDRYNIDTNDMDSSDILKLTKDVLNINYTILTNSWRGKEDNFIDFDDQIWLPIVQNLPVRKYDFVFVDETQDLNASQLELAIKVCKPNGSIIAVGDRNQSIYGFRGADTEAIPRIISRLKAKVFPLSITYRCPKSHVRLAQQYVPEIEYATPENAGYDAIEGEIIDNKTIEDIIDLAKPGDKVICRNNAPLVHPCFSLIRNGKKASILGRDLSEGLTNLMKRIKGSDLKDFLFRLERWKDKEVEKLQSKNQSIDRVIDQYETLQVLSEDCEDVKCILLKIDRIFSSEEDDITFSTIHKAKGLEVDTPENSLFIIRSYNGKQLMPSPYASKDWELIQEKNLMYVAYTRAKNKLYFVD